MLCVVPQGCSFLLGGGAERQLFLPLLWLALQISAVWSWAGLRRPDLCAQRGRGPVRGGAGRHGLTCLCGIGAAALYSSRGPCAGLGAERSTGILGAGGRRAHRTASERAGEWQDGRRARAQSSGRPRLRGEVGHRGRGRVSRAGCRRGAPGRASGGGAGVAFRLPYPGPSVGTPLPVLSTGAPSSLAGWPDGGGGWGGRLRVTTAHGPRRWLGKSKKLSRVQRPPASPAPW